MDKVQKVMSDFPSRKTWVNKRLHCARNSYQLEVNTTLVSKHRNIFNDQDGNCWLRMPWWYNIFHNPCKNVKLLHYDANFIGTALGSSEIIVPKNAIQKNKYNGTLFIPSSSIKMGSYNFRDGYTSSKWRHFVADILPNMIYCKCV